MNKYLVLCGIVAQNFIPIWHNERIAKEKLLNQLFIEKRLSNSKWSLSAIAII